jgi:hypothetical protein
LSDGDGVKTVSVKFLDKLMGNTSGAYAAGITLDTALPTGSAVTSNGGFLSGGVQYVNTATVSLTLSARTPAPTWNKVLLRNERVKRPQKRQGQKWPCRRLLRLRR